MKESLSILLLIIMVSLFPATITKADGPAVQWEKTFGGSDHDEGYSVQQTTNRGFIIAGYTASFGAGDYDVYLIRTDPNGNLLWQKTFGGSKEDCGWSIQQTSDGGFITVGYTVSFGAGNVDVYLIKANSNGNLIWQKTFGGSSSDAGYSVQQTSDGGYIITGSTSSFGAGGGDVYLVKTDPSGNLLWQKTFGGSHYDRGVSVQQTTDGGYIITGYTYVIPGLNEDVYLIKTDPNGDLLWKKKFGGSRIDNGYSVQQTFDGGFIIAGYTSQGDYADVYLLKTEPNGNLLWQKTFGGSYWDGGRSVRQTSDGGYIIAGRTGSFGEVKGDVYVIKTDSLGNLLWQKTIGRKNEDSSWSVQQTSDGGFIIAGNTLPYGVFRTDVYVIKLAPCIVGDLDYDDDVDNDDLALFKQEWLNTNCNAGNNWCSGADFDHSGNVDFVDFAKFAQHWLEGSTP